MRKIYLQVRRQLHRSSQHAMVPARHHQRTKQVSTQCLAYIAAFWVPGLGMVILRNLDAASFPVDQESKLFAVMLLQNALFPITGFCNMCIFVLPRYIRWRADNPEQSRFWAVCMACQHKPLGITDNTMSSRSCQFISHRRELFSMRSKSFRNSFFSSRQLSSSDTWEAFRSEPLSNGSWHGQLRSGRKRTIQEAESEQPQTNDDECESNPE